jgi:hypothetical protein
MLNFDSIDQLTINLFNEKFSTDIVELPQNILALGYESGKFYLGNYHEHDRSKEYINYWINVIHNGLNTNKSYYYLLCIYDGYRERIPYIKGKLDNLRPEQNQFKNTAELPETGGKIPLLHSKVNILTFNKHLNDNTAICVPDIHFIRNSNRDYQENYNQIDVNFITWEDKNNIFVWRGNINNGTKYNFYHPSNKSVNQRQYFVNLIDSFPKLKKYVDANENFLSISDQIKSKFLIDIDGFANTWDSLCWKLYSGSLVIKNESIWKQWYYDELKPWIHYVPVNNDFSNLLQIIQWCQLNDNICREIALNARNFVKKRLNYENSNIDSINAIKKACGLL